MKYARWSTVEEMKKYVKGVNLETGVKKSGLPVMYDDNFLYIDDRECHSLIVGSTGCGKTQSVTLPMIRLAIEAGDNIIVNDVKGELHNIISDKLKKEGYNVIVIDFENPSLGNSWNPLLLPYQLYKSGDKDRAIELIEDLGYYIFTDKLDAGDPFWVNSTIDFFTGLALYLFENGKEDEINLNSIYSISANGIDKKNGISYFDLIMNGIDKNSNIYFNLSGTLLAPNETKGSIISVFNQKIKRYITRESLCKMLSTSDFDIKSIGNEKTALFMVSGKNSFSNSFLPLLVSQIITCVDLYGNGNVLNNVLLDEFECLLPIKNFGKIINYCRGMRVRFTVFIKSFIDLISTYGEENAEIIKMCFGNVVYLLANDLLTLEEVSKLCGNEMVNGNIEPLITVEELKIFNNFEAIVLIPRMMPFKTKLLPDYMIDYGYEIIKSEIPSRVDKDISIFDIKSVL